MRGPTDPESMAMRERIAAPESEPYRKLAELFHDLYCTRNHTDGCGWGYEGWTVDTIWWSRPEWYQRAFCTISGLVDEGYLLETAIMEVWNALSIALAIKRNETPVLILRENT